MHRIGTIALALVLTLVVVLATRLISSNDLGYHLAYGETFLETGRPVDTNNFIFTSPSPMSVDEVEPGPGCWIDDRGRYRFPNANWASQVVLAVVWRVAGGTGLSLLLIGLVATVFGMLAVGLGRCGLPAAWIAAGLLVTAWTAESRFLLRPELFGYVPLIAQLVVLLPVVRGARPLGWKRVALLVGLQVVLVNVHSYFLIGLGLTGAAMLGALAWRWLPPSGRDAESGPDPVRVGTLLALQTIACLINPWSWRLAWLPVETVLYLRTAGGGDPHSSWTRIGELADPLAGGAEATLLLVLGIAAAAAISTVLQRQIARLSMVLGMVAVALSMGRNLAVASLVLIPVALSSFWELASARTRIASAARGVASLTASALAVVIAAWWIVLIATQQFYVGSESLERFGLGLSRANVPVEAGAWIGEHVPDEIDRVWTDFALSSNLHFLTEPHRRVPILTNTWAYPPSTMKHVLSVNRLAEPFAPVATRHDLRLVALEVNDVTSPLARELAWDPAWALVYLDSIRVVFLGVAPETLELVRRFAITPSTLDVEAHARRLRAEDPLPTHGLYHGAFTLARLDAFHAALTLLGQLLEEEPDHLGAWRVLGATLMRRGQGRLQRGESPGADDLRAARDAFRKALEIDPTDSYSRDNLQAAESYLLQGI